MFHSFALKLGSSVISGQGICSKSVIEDSVLSKTDGSVNATGRTVTSVPDSISVNGGKH